MGSLPHSDDLKTVLETFPEIVLETAAKMIITDAVKEFYAPLLHERILVLVAMDVDALCASRILQTLFQIDHVRSVLGGRVGRE